MSTYNAPLKDMQFVIRDLVGLAEISALPDFAEISAELVEAVLGEAAKFAREVLDPLNRSGDQQGACYTAGTVSTPDGFAPAYRQFVAGGWNGLAAAPASGGQGLPNLVALAVAEMWNSANLSFSLCPMLTVGVLAALQAHGSHRRHRNAALRER